MKTIKIFGHKAPDTDSICSAIIYAWYLREIRHRPATPCRLGEINPETEYVLNKFSFTKPRLLKELTPEDRIIVVDTNNLDELIDLNGANFIEVIDHHKLTGGIRTVNPINFTLRRTASTASIIYLRLSERGITNYPKGIAGLMLSAIISDSVNFTSPTTTAVDINIAKKLAKKYKININKLAEEMFDAKSNISNLDNEELVKYDSKVTDINNKKFRISVIETNKPQEVFDRSQALQEVIEEIRKEEKNDYVLLFVVDILKKQSILINSDKKSKKLIRESYTIEKDTPNGILLPGVISRKKQIIPAIVSAIN